MSECIAVINAGSSSIKFALYDSNSFDTSLYRGQIEQIGESPRLHVADARGVPVAEKAWRANGLDHKGATQEILKTARELARGSEIVAVGHRVVHGGTKYASPARIDGEVMAALTALTPLAPLHQPNNLAPIAAIAETSPHTVQVACFDTAFHRTQPDLAQLFALPRKFTDAGIRRYGFHGLSYEYIASRMRELAPALADARLVVAHLGSGASLCAIHRGRSVATTMSFTAVDGLVMGTRCGALDPGVLVHLIDAYAMDARAIEDLIYRQSGLLGVSGISSDMRELRASPEPAAREAIALFVYRIVREIGSLAAALGGLDGLIFTGGIGEHDRVTRREIGEGCRWLGLELDEARNSGGTGRIHADSSLVSSFVVPTDEEQMIARHTASILGLNREGP